MITQTQLRRLVWLGIVFAVVARLAVTIFFESSPMSAYGSLGDESVMSVGAERILTGQVPHRDFYSFAPGTAYYPLAGWFLVFGDSYSSLRIFNFITAFGICVALFLVARRFLTWLSGIPSILFAFAIFPIWPFVSYHWQLLLLGLLATAVLISPWTRTRLVLAGVLMALAETSLITKASLLLLPQVAYILLRSTRRERWSNLCWFGVGLFSIAALIVAIMTSVGMALPLWEQTITNNLTYYQDLVRSFWFVLNSVVIYLAFSILLLLTPLFLLKIPAHFPRKEYALLVGSHGVLSFSILYFLEPIHALQISLFFLIGATVAFWGIIQALKKSSLRWMVVLIPILISLSVTIAWGYGLARSETNGKHAFASSHTRYTVSTPNGTLSLNSQWRTPLIEELPVIQQLLSTSLANKRVFFFPFTPGYYYFFQRQNPTRLDLLLANHLPGNEQELFLTDLHVNTDVVVYLPRTWSGFSPNGPLMAHMQKEFPVATRFLDGNVIVLSKTPLEK